jgi:hypothetical protein
MTKKHHNLLQHVLLIVISLALFAGAVVVGAAAQTAPMLSKREVKILLATAKTPADQERLARYYRDKAEHLRAKAQEYSARADSLEGQPPILESKQGGACPCALPFRHLAKQYSQEAKDAEALAAQHEQLAQSKTAQ